MKNDSRFATDLTIEMDNVRVEPLTGSDFPRGFNFYGQEVTINNCTFDGMRHGIKNEFYLGHPMTITASTFKNCTQNGLFTFATGAVILKNCNFYDNGQHGWLSVNNNAESKAHYSTFRDNTNTGIRMEGVGAGSLELFHCDLYDNFNGIEFDNQLLKGELKAGCSDFSPNSNRGIDFNGDGLIMSKNKLPRTGQNYIDGLTLPIQFT